MSHVFYILFDGIIANTAIVIASVTVSFLALDYPIAFLIVISFKTCFFKFDLRLILSVKSFS